ncbi:MAG: hypothetical protein ABI305_08170 [Tepidiformaceae bacterium]
MAVESAASALMRVMPALEVRYVFGSRLRGTRGPKLLRYLLDRGADEFSISVMALHDTPAPFADAFEDELEHYQREVASRRAPASAAEASVMRSVRLWAFNHASLERLLSFVDADMFHCPPGPDGWLENLTIYRGGELVLGIVSHEGEGVLRLTRAEHAEAAALDIPSEPLAESIRY